MDAHGRPGHHPGGGARRRREQALCRHAGHRLRPYQWPHHRRAQVHRQGRPHQDLPQCHAENHHVPLGRGRLRREELSAPDGRRERLRPRRPDRQRDPVSLLLHSCGGEYHHPLCGHDDYLRLDCRRQGHGHQDPPYQERQPGAGAHHALPHHGSHPGDPGQRG